MDMAEPSKSRRSWVGRVLSNKMEKTVVVAIERFQPHLMYRKLRRRITTLKAHDENNQCQIGDWVRLVHTRPLSKGKHWRVIKILRQGESEE